jgi:multicomponent Na+:H+ antiporter subunit D
VAWTVDWTGVGVPWAAIAVALPLAAGLVAALSQRLAHALALPVAALGVAIAAAAALQVGIHGPVEFAIGGWQPPLGIALRVDGLSCGFLLTGSLVVAAAFAFARPAFAVARAGDAARKGWSFWPLSYCLVAALNAVFVGADLFNLYVALELLTVAAVALVALEGTPQATAAAVRYLLYAMLGSLSYLLGVALLYAEHGTLDVLLLRSAAGGGTGAVLAASLVTAGLMAKAALFPLHGWLASAHSAAPAPASALLSALVVKAPFVIVLRLWFDAVPALPTPAFAHVMGVLGACGVVLGSVLALRQERLKLVVAYSTVAQLGYLLIVFPLGMGAAAPEPWVETAWSGVVLHAIAHGLAKGAMFLAAGAMAQALGHDRIDGMAGLGRVVPIAAFAFGLAAVSLMGLPPSGGFLAKYLLLTAALGSGQWWWAILMIGGGLLAAAYLFRPLSLMLGDAQPVVAQSVPQGRQLVALALAVAAVLLGLFSAVPLRLLRTGRPAWEELGS